MESEGHRFIGFHGPDCEQARIALFRERLPRVGFAFDWLNDFRRSISMSTPAVPAGQLANAVVGVGI